MSTTFEEESAGFTGYQSDFGRNILRPRLAQADYALTDKSLLSGHYCSALTTEIHDAVFDTLVRRIENQVLKLRFNIPHFQI